MPPSSQSFRRLSPVALLCLAVFVLLLAASLYSAISTGLFHASNVAFLTRYPAAWLVATVLLVVWAAPVGLLIRGFQQFERKPLWLLLVAFLWGGVIAMTLSLYGNTALRAVLEQVLSPGVYAAWDSAIVAPVVEETAKGIGLVLILFVTGRRFISLTGGLVVGAAIGLGFQVIENHLYLLTAASSPSTTSPVTTVVTEFLGRAVLGGVLSHTLYTSLIGFGIGYLASPSRASFRRRVGVFAAAVVLSLGTHGLVNSPLMAKNPHLPTQVFMGVLATVAFTCIFVWVLRRSRREERLTFLLLLVREVGNGTLDERDIAALLSPQQRARTFWTMARRGGRPALVLYRRLQREQIRLVLAHSPRHRRPETSLPEQRDRIRSLKREVQTAAAA